MQGPQSNLLTKDDLARAYSLLPMTERLEEEQGQQPYMLKDEALMMEEDGVLFGNGAGDEDLFDYRPDTGTVTDDISDTGVYQETDVGQFVTDEGEMEPLPDPAFYDQTTASVYGMGAVDPTSLDALIAQADALEKGGQATGEQVDTAAAAAEATQAAKQSGATGTDLVAKFKAEFDAAKERRTAARAAGSPIPAGESSSFLKKYGVWLAVGGIAVLLGGTAVAYYAKKGAGE